MVIGYYQRAGFQEGASDSEIKFGYVYEYYQGVAVSLRQDDTEKSWMAVNKTLKIGYKNDYLPYSNLNNALKNNEVNTIFPAMKNIWYAEQQQVRCSDLVTSQTMNLIFQGGLFYK